MRFAELQSQREAILSIARKYGVEDIRVFGSVARDEADETSDVDLMVQTQHTSSLFDMLAFQHEVSLLLQEKVDVVAIDAIRNPLRKRYMLQDARPL